MLRAVSGGVALTPSRMAFATSHIAGGPSGLDMTHPDIHKAMTNEKLVMQKMMIMTGIADVGTGF